MSIVNGIGGPGSDLPDLLQQVAREKRGPTPTANPTAGPPFGPGRGQLFQDTLELFAQQNGLNSDDIASLQKDVKTAIVAALKESQGSGASKDVVQQAVEQAIETTLYKYGLDGAAFVKKLNEIGTDPRELRVDKSAVRQRQAQTNDAASQGSAAASNGIDLGALLADGSIGLADYSA